MNPVEESLQLLYDAWRLFVGRLPGSTVVQSDGVLSALANVELAFLNVCTHDSPMAGLDDVRRRLGIAIDRIGDSPHPWMFVLCEDRAPSGWEVVAAECDLVPVMPMTGMTADDLKPPRRPLPDLEIRRVQDVAGAKEIAVLNMHAYGLPLESSTCIWNMHYWTEENHGYVGYVDGRPVTCSAAFPVNGTVYVAFVATHPEAHRKGYAETVMRHSIDRCAEANGLSRTTLHASAAGFKLYEEMGYVANARYQMLAKPPEES